MSVALEVTWILDGPEVPLAGSIAAVLTQKGTLQLSTAQATAQQRIGGTLRANADSPHT